MTSPKEDQQPMTTREELVALRDWIRRPDCAEEFSFDDIVDWINERPVATVERLASRQEVSVEELGLALRLVTPDELLPAFFKRGSDVRKAIARDMARALLAEYHITKRTTEG